MSKKLKQFSHLLFVFYLFCQFLPGNVLLYADIKQNTSTLAPGTYFEGPEKLLEKLISRDSKHDPEQIWDRWVNLYLKTRETRKIVYFGRMKKQHQDDIKTLKRIKNLIDDVEKNLIHRDWEKSFQEMSSVIRLIHNTPLDISEISLRRLKQLFVWVYYMISENPRLPERMWDILDIIVKYNRSKFQPRSEQTILGYTEVLLDINLLLLHEEKGFNEFKIIRDPSLLTEEEVDRLARKWCDKIEEWARNIGTMDFDEERVVSFVKYWFINSNKSRPLYRWIRIAEDDEERTSPVKATGSHLLRQKIVDDERQIILAGEGTFQNYPIDYIINMFYQVFDRPRWQLLGDGNHNTGSMLVNYLLLIHLDALVLELFTGEYQYGRHLTHQELEFFGRHNTKMRMLYPDQNLARAA